MWSVSPVQDQNHKMLPKTKIQGQTNKQTQPHESKSLRSTLADVHLKNIEVPFTNPKVENNCW